jgi:hypothetical protein
VVSQQQRRSVMLKTLTLSASITALAITLGAAILLAVPANAGEDCLGLSIGPGCIGIEGDKGHHYRRVQVMPPHAHRYVAPNGGVYYYNDDTYYYEDHE